MNLSDRQTATILAALNYYRRQRMPGHGRPATADIASSWGRLEPLTEAEVDELCVMLTCKPEKPPSYLLTALRDAFTHVSVLASGHTPPRSHQEMVRILGLAIDTASKSMSSTDAARALLAALLDIETKANEFRSAASADQAKWRHIAILARRAALRAQTQL